DRHATPRVHRRGDRRVRSRPADGEAGAPGRDRGDGGRPGLGRARVRDRPGVRRRRWRDGRRVGKQMSKQNGLHLRDVPVGDGAAALRRAIASRRPLKIANLSAGWEASSWTFDTLRAASGERIVKAMLELPRSGGVLAGGQAAYEREMTFSAFLDCAESGYD